MKIGGTSLHISRSDVAAFVAFAFAWDASSGHPITSCWPVANVLFVEPALFIIPFIALALLYQKAPLLLSRKAVALVCLLGAMGVAASAAKVAFPDHDGLLSILAAALTIIFQSCIMVTCVARLSVMALPRTVLCLVGWQLCVGLLTLADNYIAPDIFNALCVASCALCLLPKGSEEVGAAVRGSHPPEKSTEKPAAEGDGRLLLPWKLFAANALFVFMIYALHAVMTQEALSVSHVGTIIAAGAIVLWYARAHPVMKFRALYNMALVFSETSIVVFALGSAACIAISAILLDAAYVVFAVFYYALLCNIRLRYHLNPLLLFATANAIECAAATLGGLVYYTPFRDDWLHLLPVLLSAGAVVAFTCFATNEDIATSWGTERRPKNVVDPSTYYATLVELCASIAMQYGLSRKESEVLLLLAQRKTAPEIAEELFIAVGTVKTHMRNI